MKKNQRLAEAVMKAEAIDIKKASYSKGGENKKGGCGCGGKQKMAEGTAKGPAKKGCGCKDGHGETMQVGGIMDRSKASSTELMRSRAAEQSIGRAKSIKTALSTEQAIKNK